MTKRVKRSRAGRANRHWLWLILAVTLAAACDDRPDGVLSEGETVDLLADLQIAEAYNETPSARGSNPTNPRLQEAVLKAHGVSEEEFSNTMAYYGRNIDDYYKLFDKVEARIKKKGEKLTGKVQDTNEGNDIWPYSRMAYFNRNMATNGLRFSIEPGDLQSGERLEWKLNLTNPEGVDGIIGVEYTDGSASFTKRNAAGNKKFEISLQSDTAKVAKRLFGYITLQEHSMPVWADSIQLLRMPFDSIEYSKIRTQQKVKPLRPRPAKTEVNRQEEEKAPADSTGNDSPANDSAREPIRPTSEGRAPGAPGARGVKGASGGQSGPAPAGTRRP